MLDGHATLSRVVPEAERAKKAYFKDDVITKTKDHYLNSLDFMNKSLEALEPPVSPTGFLNSSNARGTLSGSSLSHLPPIKLLPFDGKPDKWEQFQDRFNALIIDNRDLDDFAKTHFLSSSLKGQAAECIASIAITVENFKVAWATLKNRFESKRRLLNIHLSALLNLNAITKESASDLQSLSDKVNAAISALSNLNRSDAELWNDVLVYSVSQKFDPVTRKSWNIKTSDSDKPPLYKSLTDFLTSRIRALHFFVNSSLQKPISKSSEQQKATSATVTQTSMSACPLCKARHYFNACPKFVSGSPLKRRELVLQHKRCFNCLSSNHSVKDCKSRFSCRTCQQRHHSLLHEPSGASASSNISAEIEQTLPLTSASSSSQSSPPVADDSSAQSLYASAKLVRTQVLLATACITARSSSGLSFVVRVLLDQGSEITLILERLAQNLRSKRVNMPISLSAVGCVSAGTFRRAVHVSVSPRDSLSPSLSATALILPKLTSYAPTTAADFTSLNHLSELNWADPNSAGSDAIDMIIGADLYSSVLLDGIRRRAPGDPIAQNTVFGWVISGQIKSASSIQTRSSMSSNAPSLSTVILHSAVSLSLEDEMKRFWEVEEVPQHSLLSDEEKQCEEHFTSTHSRDSNGRYIVCLPFRRSPPIEIGESRERAKRQLELLSRRLIGNPPLHREYSDFLEEYECLGHMRQAPVKGASSVSRVYSSSAGTSRIQRYKPYTRRI